MNDGGLIAIFLQNLPVLVVVIPLLLAPILAIITAPRVAWAVSVAGVGSAFRRLGRVTYHLGNWEPPWGIEFVVDWPPA